MKKSVAVLLLFMMTVGFDWGRVQSGRDIITITVKNQFPIPVMIQVNQKHAGNIPVNSSIKIRVSIDAVPVKIEIWGHEIPTLIAAKTFRSLARDQDIIWATGDIELKPGLASAPRPSQPAAEQPAPKAQAVPPAQKAVEAPIPAKTVPLPIAQDSGKAEPTVPTDTAVFYMTAASTLSYQGQKSQNRAKTASLAKIERQRTSSGATYALSGEGAVKVGAKGAIAFYGVSPLNVKRSAADRLSSDRKGLSPWLDLVNSTLNGLAHKNMAPGAWEESIKLPFGEEGPEMILAKFRARPLPAPDSNWILITADSGLISFRPLDERYQETTVYGRYQSVLVYAPVDDEILQAAAAFTFYHGEDQFRIEQVHYAADADGNQLYPALDVGPYLNFAPVDPAITTQGAFPSWCIQAAHVLDFVHLAVMTAAEGATNLAGVGFAGQSSLNLINHNLGMAQQVLGNAGAQEFLGQWYANVIKAIASAQGIGSWSFWLRDVVSLDLSKNFVKGPRMSGPGNWWVDINKPLYVAAKKMINGKMYDIKLINDFPYAPPAQTTIPVPTPQPAPAPPITQQAPPDEVKLPADTGSFLDDLLWPLLGLGAAGAYLLADGLGGGGYDCEFIFSTQKPIGQCWVTGQITVTFPETCGCPSWASKIGTGTYEDGSAGVVCRACSGYASFGKQKLITRFRR